MNSVEISTSSVSERGPQRTVTGEPRTATDRPQIHSIATVNVDAAAGVGYVADFVDNNPARSGEVITKSSRWRKALVGAFAVAWLASLASTGTLAQPVWHGPQGVSSAGSNEPPGVATGGPHDIDIVLTENGHFYWQWATTLGVYAPPQDLSDVGATSGPTLVAGGRNKLDAFYRGKNGNLWTSWWDGTWWSAPTDLGGVPLGSAPTAVQGGAHRLGVFYLDTRGKLRYSYWDGGDWWSEPGTFPLTDVKGPVAAVTNGPHRVEVFYRSSQDRLMRFWSDGGPWSTPESMGTVVTSNPSAASFLNPLATRAAVFYRGPRGDLCVFDSYKRGPWVSQCSGIKVGDKIAAVTVDEAFDVGAATPSGRIHSGISRIWRTANGGK